MKLKESQFIIPCLKTKINYSLYIMSMKFWEKHLKKYNSIILLVIFLSRRLTKNNPAYDYYNNAVS